MADKIRVLSKRPGQPPRSVWVTNSLENLQTAVGGYIEVVRLAVDAAVICNEEGLIHNLPYNCTIAGVALFGDILMVGVDGEEFCSLPITYQEAKQVFRNLWYD